MNTDKILQLVKNDIYTTDEFDYVISHPITEYDMRDAGFNLIQYYGLLSSKKIEELSRLEKHRRTIQIGILMREDKEFSKNLTDAFGKMRMEFAVANDISYDDVISIKKDAIFILDKQLEHLSFGNVTFVPKHSYSSFHKFGNLELYFNRKEKTLDVKGISDSVLDHHKKFTVAILIKLFTFLETSDYDGFIKFMKSFVQDYKNRNLMYGYYREFNAESLYSIIPMSDDQYRYFVPDIPNSQFDEILDISYNYKHIYLPLIQRHYFSER